MANRGSLGQAPGHVGGPAFSVIDAASAPARWAMSEYFRELAARFSQGFDVGSALDEAAAAFNPPCGLFVLAGPPDGPVGCGAIKFLDDERGEIKRMWVSPSNRGRGLATQLLTFLEDLIRDSGRSTVVLDTNKVLSEAIALYERRGYRPIERYNDNPYADFWFFKSLRPDLTAE